MKTRVITALVLAITIGGSLYLGNPYFEIVMCIASILVGIELSNLTEEKNFIDNIVFILPIILYKSITQFNTYAVAIGSLLFLLFSYLLTSANFKKLLLWIFHCTFSTMLLLAILFIYNLNPNFLFFVALATFGADTGGYFFGKFFGKHKLCPTLSPKKTIEGAIGGWFLGMIVSFAYGYFFLNTYLTVIIIACFTLPIISQFGDLTFSKIKREHNLSDFSQILPGHGGFLDRIDSLTFTLITLLLIIMIFK